MTYVSEQTSAELRAHMRSLKAIKGWQDALADRLFKEVISQDAELAASLSREAALREALEAIAGFGNVNLAGEWEHGLRDIIRSVTDRAKEALKSPAA